MPFTRVTRGVIALMYAYTVAVGLGSLLWPLGRDQGIFAWAGDVLLRGGVPFADAWDVKGVATYYTFAISQFFFGRTLWGIRVLDLVFLVVTCLCLYRFFRRRTGEFAAHIGVIFFSLFYLARGYWSTAQPDGWGSMLVIISLVLILKPHGVTRRDRVLAGILIGIASLYKLLYVGFLLPLMVYECLDPERRRAISFERLGPLLLGCTGVVGASLLVLFAQGALDDFLDIQLGFNRVVHTQSFDWTLKMSARRFARFFDYFWWTLPFAGIGLYGLWRREGRLARALLVLVFVSVACIVVQNKYYGYHWHPFRMSLLVLLGFGVSQILLFAEKLGSQRVVGSGAESASATRQWAANGVRIGCIAALISVFVFFRPELNRMGWSALVTRSTPVEDYYKSYKSIYNWSFKFFTNMRVAEYIAAHSQAGDSLLVWGFEPMINFLTGMPAPTRFGYNYPLVARQEAAFTARYRAEFLMDMRAAPPTYIVVGVGDQNSLLKKSSRKLLDSFEGFLDFVERDYVFETQIGGFELWRHSPRDPANT